MIKVGIVTCSDKGSQGLRIDLSGKVIEDRIAEIDGMTSEYIMISDDRYIISETLKRMCDELKLDLILTTGGTGFSQRDITPEATLDIIERNVPGIPEAMRAKSFEITSRAMLSRAVAGIRGRSLIINLPGSPKAVSECLDVVLPVIAHALAILKGEAGECAR